MKIILFNIYTAIMEELISLKELIAQKHSADMVSGRVAFGHAGFAKRKVMAKKR